MPTIIFDMDGVIFNSEPLHMEVERALYRELAIDIPLEEHHTFTGMVPLQIWGLIRKRFKLTATAAELKDLEQQHKLELFRQRPVPLVPGVLSLLEAFRERQYRLALASSSPKAIIELFTSKAAIQSFFEFLLSGEEVPSGKPAPDIFLESARRLGVPPETCLVIEDSGNGVRAAKAAGMTCIGFQNPQSGPQDLGIADVVLDRFDGEGFDQIMHLIQQVSERSR